LSNQITSLALGTLLNASDNGRHIPMGGISAVEKSLMKTILEHGGKVYSLSEPYSIKGLEIEEIAQNNNNGVNSSEGRKEFRAVGVNILSDSERNQKKEDNCLLKTRHSIISGLGVLGSYSTLIPLECIHEKTKQNLSSLKEMRPKLKICFWVNGSREDLGISSIDYYETAKSVFTPSGSGSTETEWTEKVANSFTHVWSPSAQDPTWTMKEIQTVIVEFELTEPIVSTANFQWFPSSVDEDERMKGPQFFVSAKDELTNPNHLDYSLFVGGKHLQLTASQKNDFIRRGELLLHSLYPKTFQKISHTHVIAPTLGGYQLSNHVSKFAAELSVKTEINVRI
jgi:hypothetical protein